MENDKRANDVERRLRRGLEPERETVERIVRRSLAAESKYGRSPWILPAVAGAAAIVLAIAVTIFLPRSDPSVATGAGVDGPRPVELVTITNVSGEVEVLFPPERHDGGTATAGPPAADPGLPRIFNRNGIVAAFARAGDPHNFIVGGGS
jgi:hypothetical protein